MHIKFLRIFLFLCKRLKMKNYAKDEKLPCKVENCRDYINFANVCSRLAHFHTLSCRTPKLLNAWEVISTVNFQNSFGAIFQNWENPTLLSFAQNFTYIKYIVVLSFQGIIHLMRKKRLRLHPMIKMFYTHNFFFYYIVTVDFSPDIMGTYNLKGFICAKESFSGN